MTIAIGLDDDQALLVDTTRRFIEAELPLTATRALHGDPNGFDRSWWQRGAELGWFAMLVPEELGGGDGDGKGLVGAALIAELHGANVQPGPLVGANVVAWAIATAGTAALRDEVLDAVIDGSSIATWTGPLTGSGAISLAARGDHALTLNGTAAVVQDAATADLVLVDAVLEGEPVQVLVDATSAGLDRRSLEGLDLGRRFAAVTFTDVVVPTERVLAAPGLGEGMLRRALVLNAAETVGAMDALLTMTVDYAKDRTAFGRPIGSFQVIKHILADQALYLETGKAGVDAVLRDVGRDDPQATELAHVVAAYIGEHGNELAQECLQVHGGIGFTWEHDLHLLMRRIRTNSAQYGSPSRHRDAIWTIHEGTR